MYSENSSKTNFPFNVIFGKLILDKYFCETAIEFFRKLIDSLQTRCIVKGEAQKSPLFWWFSGGFCFSQDRLFSRNSTREPLNLIKSPIFTNAPCKPACLYNAPSMHTLELIPKMKDYVCNLSGWSAMGYFKLNSVDHLKRAEGKVSSFMLCCAVHNYTGKNLLHRLAPRFLLWL